MAFDNNQSMTNQFHCSVGSDIDAIFKAYERGKSAEAARILAFERLRGMVHAFGNNGEYDLVDVSCDSLPGMPKFHHAPLECIIVDKSSQLGLPLVNGSPLPYDAVKLAEHLLQNGYHGTFVDSKPAFFVYNSSDPDILSKPVQSPLEPAWGQLYTPFSSVCDVLPPILRIRPEHADDPEIHLSPANTTNLLRWNLLSQVLTANSSFKLLSSFFWLWLRSHGLEHYSWSTCAFLVMFYLQDRYKPLEAHEDTPLISPRFWRRIDCIADSPTNESSGIPRTPCLPDPPSDPSSLLFNFFSFWTSNGHLTRSRVLQPLTGLRLRRSLQYTTDASNLDEVEVMDKLKKKTREGQRDAYWRYNPIVLSDPFIPSHNIAHGVTEHAFKIMLDKAQAVTRTLKNGFPLTDVLGSSLTPPTLSMLRPVSELLRDSMLSQSTNQSRSSSPTLLASLGRSYHTSSRSRTRRGHAAIAPPPFVNKKILDAREATIDRVRRIIRRKYGDKYFVECFGSTQYGVDSPTSDLDLVVLDESRRTGFTPDVNLDSLPAIYNVRHLSRTLEYNGFRIHCVISQASVPIVKFEDFRTRISCDICVNDRLGLFNTRLIARYCSLSPLLRNMLVLIKQWAKSLGLNDPAGQGGTSTFSSYALMLMTIGFLQAHELLPNLQQGLPPLKEGKEFWTCGKNGFRTRCDPRFNESPEWSVPTNVLVNDLRSALMAWFRFWGHQFNYHLDVMSIRDGGIIPRTDPNINTISAMKQESARRKRSEKKEKMAAKISEKQAFLETLNEQEQEQAEARENSPEDQLPNPESVVVDVAAVGQESTLAERVTEHLRERGWTEQDDAASAEKVVAEERKKDSDVDEELDRHAPNNTDEADVEEGHQPSSWARSPLVIADPFIVAKNCVGQMTSMAVLRFNSECRRALLLLTNGRDFEDILGDGRALNKSYNRRRRKERGGRKLQHVLRRAEENTAKEAHWLRRGQLSRANRNESESGRESRLDRHRSDGAERQDGFISQRNRGRTDLRQNKDSRRVWKPEGSKGLKRQGERSLESRAEVRA